jgi:hypothetical protein
LNLCLTQTDCEATSTAGYWYSDVCNAEPEAPACTPDWQCDEWDKILDTVACGETFTQTRTCTDSNSCGTDEGKPTESQEIEAPECPEPEPTPEL